MRNFRDGFVVQFPDIARGARLGHEEPDDAVLFADDPITLLQESSQFTLLPTESALEKHHLTADGAELIGPFGLDPSQLPMAVGEVGSALGELLGEQLHSVFEPLALRALVGHVGRRGRELRDVGARRVDVRRRSGEGQAAAERFLERGRECCGMAE